MQPFQSLSIALVASLSLLAATTPSSSSALASQVDVNSAGYSGHFARRGGHNSVRSVVLDHGKKLRAKRATQAQQEAAARAKQWSDDFAKQNSAWQAAANADLAQGKTPQDFDTWAASNGGRDGKGHDSPDSDSSSQGVQQQQQQQNQQQDDSQQDTSSGNDQGDDEDDEEDDGEDYDEDEDDEDDDSSSSSSSSSSASASSSPSASSSASSSQATAAKKQAYKQDNSSEKQSQQKQNNNSSSKSSSGSGLLAGISNVVTGGQVTYYNTGLGACGWTNKDSDYIVALPVGVWNRIGGAVSNGNIVCGKKLKVSNGQTAIEVEITDQCPSCDDGHLDLSPAAFKALGDQSKGVLPVSWGWVNGEPHK